MLLTPEGRDCFFWRVGWCVVIQCAFFAGWLTPPPAPRRPLARVCFGGACWRWRGFRELMCRNSAPSSAFSGERGTGIAPRFRIRGMLLPRRPPRSSAKLSSQGLLVICCVSAPPLSSITLLIRHYPTHKKKRSVLRQRSGTEPRFF